MSFDQFLAVLQAFAGERVDDVLVGGVAVNIHGIVRSTEGIDFFVPSTEENVARIRAARRSIWPDPHIDEITATDLAGSYPTVRYGPPDWRHPDRPAGRVPRQARRSPGTTSRDGQGGAANERPASEPRATSRGLPRCLSEEASRASKRVRRGPGTKSPE